MKTEKEIRAMLERRWKLIRDDFKRNVKVIRKAIKERLQIRVGSVAGTFLTDLVYDAGFIDALEWVLEEEEG